jgi:hypothetical protein
VLIVDLNWFLLYRHRFFRALGVFLCLMKMLKGKFNRYHSFGILKDPNRQPGAGLTNGSGSVRRHSYGSLRFRNTSNQIPKSVALLKDV